MRCSKKFPVGRTRISSSQHFLKAGFVGATEHQFAKLGFITPSDPKWSACLDRVPHDFYHLPGYVQLCARIEKAEATAFYAEHGDAACLMPFLCMPSPKRDGNHEFWCDLISPYGYAAPLLTHPADRELTAHFFDVFRAQADQLGASSACFRLHPLLTDPVVLPVLPLAAIKQHGLTVSIDLLAPEQEIWQKIRRGHRYEIRRLEKMGFYASVDNWEEYDDFKSLYLNTMTRVHADSLYQFQDDYFQDLRRVLGESLHLCLVRSPDGTAAAAALFTTVGTIAEYHLSGSNRAFQHFAPTKLVLHAFRLWAREHGCSVLHLGGGLGAKEDTLFHFKAGFSDRRHSFCTYRMVLSEERYRILASTASSRPDPYGDIGQEFFPSYRR